jgi:hypothetical protein
VSLAAGWEFYQLVSKEYMQQLSADVVFEEYMQQLSADVVFEEYMQQLSACFPLVLNNTVWYCPPFTM